MELIQPGTWNEALHAKAAHPEALPLWGGTDVMVDLNFGRERPEAILDLTRIGELAEWGEENGGLRVGAGVSYTRAIAELGDRLPGLAAASRTVGSPQIRNRGTIGGNLGSSSPAGDALPPLYASDAEIELASLEGSRRVPIGEFITGPKQNTLAPDELIAAFHVKRAGGPQEFSKVGTRNAMVIAVCSFALALHPEGRRVGTCLGSAGPTPIRASEAEAFAAGELDWDGRAAPSEATLTRFGELVAAAARPIDDVRGSAAYRRRALSVLARRSLSWAWGAL
jgi:CO/xanthine dehydrogenase FAD-binding subunit